MGKMALERGLGSDIGRLGVPYQLCSSAHVLVMFVSVRVPACSCED